MTRHSLPIAIILPLIAGCQPSPPPPGPVTQPTEVAPASPGNQSSNPAPNQPTTGATNGPQKQFEDSSPGLSLMYPSDWKPVTGTKSQLKIASADGGQLTLDVPVLPPHFPGMIPMDPVRSGYIDDLKKRITGASVTDLPSPAISDSQVRRVKISGQTGGKPAVNEAVLILHKDHIFILSIDADDKNYERMHNTLDQVLASLKLN